MDALTRHRVLALAGIVHARAFEEPDEPVDDFDEELDEDTAALVEALASFDDGERSWDPAKHPRNPKGTPGGGRFKSAVERIVEALTAWSKGEGSNDPLQGFDREQLRLAAKKRGLTIRRGAPRDEIAKALLDDLRVKVRAERGQPKPSAKFTLQGPEHHNLDVAVYRQPGSQAPELYQENDAGKRGALVQKFDNLDELAKWADANGEPRLAEWARKEAGAPSGGAPDARVLDALSGAPRDAFGQPKMVPLADLREQMGMDREEFDRTMTQLARDGRITLIPQEDQKRLKARDRAAALRFGDQPNHFARISPDSSPAALEQAAVDRQAAIDSARTVADTLAEVDQLVNDGASVKALQARLDSRRKLGAPSDVVDELAAAARADQARVHEVEVENRIRQAYRDAAAASGRRGLIPLADVRERVHGVDRTEVDAALIRMVKDLNRPGVTLMEEEDRRRITPRDREAAITIPTYGTGGANHWLTIEDPSPRPLPSVDRSRIDQARADIAKRYGLTPLGSAGAVEPFDPNRHEMIGGAGKPAPGTPVQVVRPGHEADINGEKVQVGRAGVMAADTPAAALLSTDPTFREEFESALKKLPRAGGPTPAKAVKKTAPATGKGVYAALPIRDSDSLYAVAGNGFGSDIGGVPGHKVVDAIADYEDQGYQFVNGALREATGDLSQISDQPPKGVIPSHYSRKRVLDMVEGVDAAMKVSRTDRVVIVYRGVLSTRDLFGANVAGSAVGREWTDSGYVSTSIAETGTAKFTGNGVGPKLRIHVPAGTGAIGIENTQPGLRGEREVLLERGLTFRVVGDRTMGGQRVLDVEVVPSAPTKAVKKTAPRAPKLSTSDIIANADLTPGQKRARLRARGMSKEEIDALVPLPSVSSKTRDRVLKMASLRALGHDVTPGHDELHHYWVAGPGLAKWVHSPKPWTTLVALLTRHVGPEKAKVYASRWFIEVFHFAAGSDLNRVTHGHPPRGHRIGPG